MKIFLKYSLSLLLIFTNSLPAFCKDHSVNVNSKQTISSNKETKTSSPSNHKTKKYDYDVYPVPLIDLNPASGNTWGLMPVLLMANHQTQAIKAILGVFGQSTKKTSFDGGALAYIFPTKEDEIKLYSEVALDYYREFSARYFAPHFKKKFYLESNALYLNTPFGRFYGLGPRSEEGDETNYIGRTINLDLTGGYYFLKNIRANYTFRFHTTDVKNKALEEVSDTFDEFGNLPNVVDATNFFHEFSTTFDNRDNREYSTKGTLAQAGYFFSNKKIGSDQNFQGYNVTATQLIEIIPNRLTTAARFYFQQFFGDNVPFYELSALGGERELRAYVLGRFVDKGKMLFQLEERFRLASPKLFGKNFDVYTDPFFEVGRVFPSLSKLGANYWKPVGGLGIRAFVPPNVIGRLDIGIGGDGLELYTELGYPF